MFRNFIEWIEKDKARGRKVVLIITVFMYLFITVGIFAYGMIDPTKLSDKLDTLYMIFTGLMASIYAFYTGTSTDKSNAVANKASELLLNKLDQMGNKNQ